MAKDFERVAAKVTEKLSAKAAHQKQVADRHEAMAQKAARRADTFDRVASTLGALDVWFRSEPATRRPRLTRDEITAAAIQVADTDGFGAVSMRRIADELGAGTMTLYHYVRTKDELLTLVNDAVMGEVVVPDDVAIPDDWRDALVMIAHRTRDTLLRHPWILDITDDPPVGPNSVRHFDQTLQAVAGLDIDLAAKFDVVSAIDEYVFGACLHERNNRDQHGERATEGRDMVGYVGTLVRTGGYPQLAELAGTIGLDALWDAVASHMGDPERFDRNLRRLLTGIEVDLGLDQPARSPTALA
jgi:AcrR family transcriptional regulator